MLQIKLLGHNVCLRSLQDIYFASHRAEKEKKANGFKHFCPLKNSLFFCS